MDWRKVVVVGCLMGLGWGCHRSKARLVSELDVSAKTQQGRLLRGFYPGAEGTRWRWTARAFAVALDVLPVEREVYLELEYGLPEELTNEVTPVTLIASVNGVEVGRETHTRPGHYVLTRYVPVRALKVSPAEVEFELDRSATLPGDGRVIGLMAISAGLKRYEATIEARQNKVLLARQGYQASLEQLQRQLPAGKALELKKLFARLPVLDQLKFQNVPIRENPLDLWALQQIVWEVQPEFVVTTGGGPGGLALYLAQVLDGLGLDRARILAAGPGNPAPEALQHFLRKKYVEFVKGEATDGAVRERIQSAVRGRSTLVVLNAGQSAERVLEELRAYAPLVSPGSYVVVEDTEANALSGQVDAERGPFEAVQQYLAEDGGKRFEVDRGREMALFTRNAGGWLRRK